MRRLTGLDAEFLAMESSAVPGHVAGVWLLDAASAARPLDLERLRSLVAGRLHVVPAFRRRLVPVPLGLDHPYWADDPDLSLDHHVRETVLPFPGDDAHLARQLARLHARPLDRQRPLWEVHLISGLAGGRAALYGKVHRAALDGADGEDLLRFLFDSRPAGHPMMPAPPWSPRPLPCRTELLGRGAASLALRPLGAARLGADVARQVPALAAAAWNGAGAATGCTRAGGDGDRGGDDPSSGRFLPQAPPTPFNATITPHRRCALAELPLPALRQVADRAGTGLDAVLLAVVSGALRDWLAGQGAPPGGPLVAAVPVDPRRHGRRGRSGRSGTRLSVRLVALPTDVPDPAARLVAVSRALATTGTAPGHRAAIPAGLLADATSFAVPAVAVLGWRLSSALHLLERFTPWNLFVTITAGSPAALYCGGVRVLAHYTLPALTHGQGLAVTAVSYTDRICVGFLGCRSLVPDIDRMAARLPGELSALQAAGSRAR